MTPRSDEARERLRGEGIPLASLVGPLGLAGGLGIPALCAVSPLIPVTAASTLAVTALSSTLLGVGAGSFMQWRRERELYLPPVHPEGLVMGMTDQGLPFVWPDAEQPYHGLIVGQSGAGKTNQLWNVFVQQVLRGGAAIFVNAKPSDEDLRMLWWLVRATGREHQLRVLLPGDPRSSHSWNPLQWGTPEQRTNLLTSLRTIGTTSVTDYYHGAQDDALSAVIGTLCVAGGPFMWGDVLAGLVSPTGRERLLKIGKWRGYTDLAEVMGQYRRGDRGFDEEKWLDILRGILQMLRRYVRSEARRIVLAERGDIDLRDVVRKRQLLYVALPTQTAQKSAFEWGNLIVNALCAVAGDCIKEGVRPTVPVLVILDESPEYLSRGMGSAFTQWRAAHMCVFAAAQQISQLLSRPLEEVGRQILGNSGCKEFLRQEEWEDAEAAASQIGKEIQLRASYGVGTSHARTQKGSGANYSGLHRSEQRGLREEEDYAVRPELLRGLADGMLYHRWAKGHERLRSPLVKVPLEWLTPYERLDYPTRNPGGIGLWEEHQGEVMAALGRLNLEDGR
ncbi:MAG: type IV secretory system conjugative DNA transfer family protein [Acidobacteriota bacterium]